jgi:hypothetical protein
VLEFDKLSRNPATSSRCRWIPGISPFWLDPAVLAESPARTAGFRSTGRDPVVLCRIPATLPEFVYAKYKKKIFLYYFILIFFIFRTRQTPKNDFDGKYFSEK